MALSKHGGFSSLCIFSRKLGSDDEAAGLQERAERLLYFFPREVPQHAQLKHIGLCEGIIDFVRTFNGEFSSQVVTLQKRRFAFLQTEPDIWLVLVLVNQQVTLPPPTDFVASTDSKADHGRVSAIKAAIGAAKSASLPASLFAGCYTTENISDTALIALLRQHYDVYALFFGSVTRVTAHPSSVRFVQELANIRAKLRKLVDRRETLVANYESLLRRAADEATLGIASASPTLERVRSALPCDEVAGSGTYTTGSSRAMELGALAAEVASVSRDADGAQEELARLQLFSPIIAIRQTLKNVFDFVLHYTDWSHISTFDVLEGAKHSRYASMVKNLSFVFCAGLKVHHPAKRAATSVMELCKHLQSKVPLVQHVALLYDGYVVGGRDHPAMDTVYAYLRLHAFHVMRGTFTADVRPMDFTSLTPVPVHIRSKSGMLHTPGAVSAPQTAVRRATSTQIMWAGALDAKVVRAAVDDACRDAAGMLKMAASLTPQKFSGSVSSIAMACVAGDRGAAGASNSAPVSAPATPSQNFYRGAKPASLAVPALPAAAACRRCLRSVITVDETWPVLDVPYVSMGFLQSLERVAADEPSAEAAPIAAEITSLKSSGCIGPQLPPRRRAPGSAEAVDDGFIFCPPLFADNINASCPSHRLLWYEQGLVSLLCFVDAEMLVTANKSMLGFADGGSRSDVPAAAIQVLSANIRDIVAPFMPQIETALSESMNLAASSSAAIGLESTKNIFVDTEERGLRTHGYSTVARRPGRGRDPSGAPISQAAPIFASAFDLETPRHLQLMLSQVHEQMLLRCRTACSSLHFGTVVSHGKCIEASPPLQRALGLADHVGCSAERTVAVHQEARKFWASGQRAPEELYVHVKQEQHVLACRYEGGISSFRSEGALAMITLDVKTPPTSEISSTLMDIIGKHSANKF